MHMEFLLVIKSEVWKPEFGRRNVYICDAVKVALVPLQPIIAPSLRNTLGSDSSSNQRINARNALIIM